MPPLTSSEIPESENEAEGEGENIMENEDERLTPEEKLTKETPSEVPVEEILLLQEESPLEEDSEQQDLVNPIIVLYLFSYILSIHIL